MKCVDAYWELRNLGVRTIKITVEKDDTATSPDELLNMIEGYRRHYDAQYVVVRSDTRYTDLNVPLQTAGYWLIENSLELKITREDALAAIEEYKHVYADVSYRLATDDDIQLLFDEFERGIFEKDEIALDPRFGEKVANRRLKLWTKDIIARGGKIFIALYNNNPIGFFTGEGKNSDGFGGAFNRPDTKNWGSMFVYAGHKCFTDSGGKHEKFCASTNNIKVIRLHLAFGAKIINIRNTFVKHFD